jgi:hypothetical protein
VCVSSRTQDATLNLIADDPFAVKAVDPHQRIALPYLPALRVMCVTEDMCERDTSRQREQGDTSARESVTNV